MSRIVCACHYYPESLCPENEVTTQPEALRLADEIDTEELSMDRVEKWVEEAAAELRRQHDECNSLARQLNQSNERNGRIIAERDALLEALRHAAEIAHNGGLQAMTEWDALVAVRQLTLPYFVKSGGLTETHDRLRAAMLAAREVKP